GVAEWFQRGRLRTKDSEIQLAVEEGHPNTVRCEVIPMCTDRALDQASESETSKIVGHLGGGIRATEERCDPRPEMAVTETGRYMREAGEGLTQGLDARIAEPQSGDPPAP